MVRPGFLGKPGAAFHLCRGLAGENLPDVWLGWCGGKLRFQFGNAAHVEVGLLDQRSAPPCTLVLYRLFQFGEADSLFLEQYPYPPEGTDTSPPVGA